MRAIVYFCGILKKCAVMPREFEALTAEEQQLLIDAIPLITILVAGADGVIDEREIEWAEKLTEIRSFDFKSHLNTYFEKVGQQFSDRLAHYTGTLPQATEDRQQVVSDMLSGLNPILRKMDDYDASIYYQNFLTFAKHVAKASGGILRFMSIGPEEREVIGLPMLEDFNL
jgi:hypothetical protein